MGQEIERKYLVEGDEWRSLAVGQLYRQGYLPTEECTVRVRVIGKKGFLTIKGPSTGISRSEFEYEIPTQDALDMMDSLCVGPLIEKMRYRIERNGLIWEVDEFMGENEGLIMAEVELEEEDQVIDLPDWIGEEVSGDPRYFNSSLAKFPFTHW
ncbi:MAG: CYTH domain-containing protein [Leptolyngbyaceae cyanobacterium MO_188.B28]|nr:CYTH domain-containing protein [Leptolyngbyaceae cyanobacterium MO_188.B28]